MGLRIDRQALVGLLHGAEQRIDLREVLDLVAPEFDAVGIVVVGGEHLDDVAANAKSAALEIGVVAFVKDLYELGDNLIARNVLPLFQHEQHAVVGLGRSQTVDATDARNDHAIAALEEALGGGKAQLVQFVIDGGVLFDVDVAGGNVGFGLVIVVVADEVFHRGIGEERLELVVKLGGKRLVVRQDERRTVDRLDHLGHREGLAAIL